MIAILFFLGISLSQVSAMAIAKRAANECSDEAKDSECCVVAQIYNQLSPNKVSVSSPTSCCNKGGVSCNGEKVTKINWGGQSLTGSIPSELGKLVNLQEL
jgi:hypothetical protein